MRCLSIEHWTGKNPKWVVSEFGVFVKHFLEYGMQQLNIDRTKFELSSSFVHMGVVVRCEEEPNE